MNIFILHHDPIIAAQYHCDQHIHKMILESAQMISTVCSLSLPPDIYSEHRDFLYKPTHANHPCTKWLQENYSNVTYLKLLVKELEYQRTLLNSSSHASMPIFIVGCQLLSKHSFIPSRSVKPTEFAECLPMDIKFLPGLTTVKKYQQYYIRKRQEWLDKGRQMTYKGREFPPFLLETKEPLVNTLD